MPESKDWQGSAAGKRSAPNAPDGTTDETDESNDRIEWTNRGVGPHIGPRSPARSVEIGRGLHWVMPLRIRCPNCRTVQRVPAGVRPVCPQCGFAGNSAQARQEAPVTAEGQTWAEPEAQNVSWETPGAPAASGDATPATTGEAWGEAQWPEGEATGEAPKKKGWFGRAK